MFLILAEATNGGWDSLLNLGPAAGLVVVVAGTLWRTARWVKPYFERAFEAHINLVNSLEKQTTENTATLGEIRDLLKEQKLQ